MDEKNAIETEATVEEGGAAAKGAAAKGKRSRIAVADITIIALSAAIITVCSWISIPMTVPFTLQTFAVFTVAGLFGVKRGTLSVLVYMLLGAIGIPVFSGMQGGIEKLLGLTGGYIVGFIFVALIVGYASDKFNGKVPALVISMLLGLVVCYAFGTAWFMVIYTRNTGAIGLGAVLSMCVIPFIIPDCIKIACAVILSNRVRPVLMKIAVR